MLPGLRSRDYEWLIDATAGRNCPRHERSGEAWLREVCERVQLRALWSKKLMDEMPGVILKFSLYESEMDPQFLKLSIVFKKQRLFPISVRIVRSRPTKERLTNGCVSVRYPLREVPKEIVRDWRDVELLGQGDE